MRDPYGVARLVCPWDPLSTLLHLALWPRSLPSWKASTASSFPGGWLGKARWRTLPDARGWADSKVGMFICLLVFWPRRRARGFLLPRPGIEPASLAVKTWSANHWTARQVPSWDVYCLRAVGVGWIPPLKATAPVRRCLWVSITVPSPAPSVLVVGPAAGVQRRIHFPSSCRAFRSSPFMKHRANYPIWLCNLFLAQDPDR